MGTNKAAIVSLIEATKDKELQQIANKIINKERISFDDGVMLFEKGSLSWLGTLANYVREQKHGDKTYFNKNFHIEPTNVCVFSCKFCSYSKLYANREEGWELSIEQMMHIVKSYDGKPVTEVHIVGGVHPKMNLNFFLELLQAIKAHRPDLHIKGFTPVELDYMFKKAKVTTEEGMKLAHEAGLDSLPGGGPKFFIQKLDNKFVKTK
jgi:aminodeoxyfutalosine synthase